VRLIYTENVHHLALPPGHKFPLGKYGRILENLARDWSKLLLLGAPATRDDLLCVHDARYVDAVQSGSLTATEVRRLGFPWSPSLVLRSRRSVGGTLGALAWAMQEGAAGHLAGGTHHAFRDRGEGFCVFNDIAVAIAIARRDYGVRRVAVIDLDVHQGNGTAAIFAEDPDVFTLSLHGERNYPFQKETSRRDIGLPDGCGDAMYLSALDAALPEIRAFVPELVFFQAGVDTLEGDRLGRMALSLQGLRARDARVYALARELDVPLVVTLGGGYGRDIERTIAAHTQVFDGLARDFAVR
jgi:acetoin utilization deacetylase AcuC-like enzyme